MKKRRLLIVMCIFSFLFVALTVALFVFSFFDELKASAMKAVDFFRTLFESFERKESAEDFSTEDSSTEESDTWTPIIS